MKNTNEKWITISDNQDTVQTDYNVDDKATHDDLCISVKADVTDNVEPIDVSEDRPSN